MITEREQRVIILLKAAIRIVANYHECHFSEETAINDILSTSEVALGKEAKQELITWLKESEL